MRNLTPLVDRYEALWPFISNSLESRVSSWGFASAHKRPAGQLATSRVLCYYVRSPCLAAKLRACPMTLQRKAPPPHEHIQHRLTIAASASHPSR